MEQGLLTFFDITHCGFYRLRQKGESKHIDGSVHSVVSSLKNWVDGVDVEDTIPWCTKNNPVRPKFYCKSVEVDSQTGDSLFVFWKKYGDESGNVNGIRANSKVGAKSKDTFKIKVGNDVILGQPLYYWFIPSLNLLATIKLPNSIADTENVTRYIRSCMDLRINSQYKKKESDLEVEDESGNQTFRENVSYVYSSEEELFSMKFRFNAKMKELKIQDSNISSLADKITHIVIRDTISATDVPEKAAMYNFFDKLTKVDSSVTVTKKIEYSYEETPTPDELAGMINDYYDGYDPSGENTLKNEKWNNVGFRMNGANTQTRWFDGYFDRSHIKINKNEKQEDSYYPAASLLKVLMEERKELLSFVL